MNEVKKSSSVNEMYEDLKKMRIERKIDRILDSLSELSYSMISGRPGSGAGTGIRGAGSAIGRGGSGTGAGTGIRGAGTPSRPRSEDFDMDSPDHDHESYIEDNPPDEGKQSLSVSARPYDHPIKASSSLSVEQGFAFMKDEFTNDEGISKVSDEYTDDDENSDWQDSEYDDGPAEEINSQKLDNEINTVPNQNAAELHDDIEDEMLGEMVDEVLEGLQGPGGKFGFMGEEGYKGTMGEDSNSSEEK